MKQFKEGCVGIVFVNYNSLQNQLASIQSLYKSTYQNCEYIVVDNGSKDGSVEAIRQKFPKVHVIDTGKNTGFAGGTNVGIRYSLELGTEYTLVINNDIEVKEDMLEILMKNAGENTVVVPKIFYFDNPQYTWYVGGEIKWKIGQGIHWNYNQLDTHEYDIKRKVTYASGCCMLIPNTVFDKIGLFPENYFMYYEDADYCVSMLEKDVAIWYVPDAIMWHKVCSSTGGEDSPVQTYYMSRNKLLFMHKYCLKIPATAYFYTYIRYFAKILCHFFYKHNNKYIWPAVLDYWKKKDGKTNRF